MRRLIYGFFVVILISAPLMGCGTILDRSTQKVEVITPGIKNAECHLQNDKHHYVVMTPGTERVEKTKHDLTVTCTKSGYRDAVATLPSLPAPSRKQNVWTLGLGLGYDHMSGAAYYYPSDLKINMVAVDNPDAYEARKKWEFLEDWDSTDRTVDQDIDESLTRLYEQTETQTQYDFNVTEGGEIEIFETSGTVSLPDDMEPEPLEQDGMPAPVLAPTPEQSTPPEEEGSGFFGFKRPEFMDRLSIDSIKPSDVPAELNR